ncbi:MAG: dipeptidase [Acidimicrobiia bacterium]|nr:dipeptidase [Acidimicrobiia bacterium]MBT8193024.1 dipeptidase [Acidimicrobiia bacterium]MBT8246882.1 dipeptidase [Acidimicrobiia bacterium]NNF87629.1 dipeptidase [Acidimicrobiia bacterium]NNJ46709.1 dipeptidase [Acidimicrobiia bacterium]
MITDIAETIADQFSTTRTQLEELVKIPSVSASGFDPVEVRRSAEATAGLLESIGMQHVRLLEHGDAHPAVFGELPAPAGAPTVLLYAHHDVQPPGGGWSTDPFEPIDRAGRLFGRGTSDDKCGVVLHAAALRALEGSVPVGIKVFVEGEEEIGSPHLTDFLATHGDTLSSDVIVIADSSNWRTRVPSFTTSLRGLVDCEVEVRTKRHAVHSGMYGGVFPDALTALSRLLATLHDEAGRVAIARLVAEDADPLDLTEDELRTQVAAHDTLELIGSGSLTSRLWRQPALSVLAIDAPRVNEAINALVPVATAKVSLRLPPGQDPDHAMAALRDHLVSRAPWGAQVTVTPGSSGQAFSLETGGPGYAAFARGFREAWEEEPVEIGQGGSIPFVAAFSDAFPAAEILLTGVGDEQSRAHGPDESVDLDELRRGCLAEAIALVQLGDG